MTITKQRKVALLGVALGALTLMSASVACRPTEPWSVVNYWLQSRSGVSTCNLVGAWKSQGWGEGYFKQYGSQIRGNLGGYNVVGALRGCTLSIAFYSGGSLSYTATVTVEPTGMLVGKYYYSTRQDTGWPILLRRVR